MMSKQHETYPKKLEKRLLKAEEQCRLNGSKLTLKRKQVLSILLDVKKAISAYELIDIFEDKFQQNMPPMSAYRVLDYLVNLDLAHKINVANKFVACAHIGCENNHDVVQLLFCNQCQNVQEMPVNPSIAESFTNELENSGFQLCSQQIELNCICNSCSDNHQQSQLQHGSLAFTKG